MNAEELESRIGAHLGVDGEPEVARDPVNAPMIRHWCDAVDDRNPVYTDPEFASASEFGGIVAPPTMLQAWTMRGLRPADAPAPASSPMGEVLGLLDAAGYTSVVATNCRQEYLRYLEPGDVVTATSRVESVSSEKKTGLGTGRFVTQVIVYRDQRGEDVAKMTWSLLKFRPRKAAASAESTATRPRPAQTQDSAFFWEGITQDELRIQRCSSCGQLRHPPGPMCPSCHSLDWDTLVASGRGEVYSHVAAHHPAVPPFDSPNVIVLVELEEGPRIVSNLIDTDRADVAIGLPVEVVFTQVDPELKLPLFRPRARS